MNDKWRGVLTNLSLGIILGKKPKDVIKEEATEVATEAVNDKLESTGLALCDKEHIQNALSAIDKAKIKTRSTDVIILLAQAQSELEGMLK